jgi:hypothetical protein
VTLPRHRKSAVLEGVRPELLAFCLRNGLFITSAKDSTHNVGSKHYRGEAVDVRSRSLEEAFIGHLKRDAEQHSLILRDERKRPPGQKVYGGPHLHIEMP